MPSNIKSEILWQKAKKTISKTVNVKQKPQMFYALVTNEYKRHGGGFAKPGPKGKRSIKKNPPSKDIKNFEMKKFQTGGDFALKAVATGNYKGKFFKLKFQGGTWGPKINWDTPRKVPPAMKNAVEGYAWNEFEK